MKKANLLLSIAAGLLGGILSHYVWAQPVHAQNQPARPAAPAEVRAQSFVLVNDQGKVQGVFTYAQSSTGRPIVQLFDGAGREIWSAGGNPAHPLSAAAVPNR